MKVKLLDYKHIPAFDGGTGIEFHNEHIYITDNDSKEILILTQNYKEVEKIPLFTATTGAGTVIHKDLHAATIVEINKIPRLLAIGTDTDTQQHKAALINLDDLTREEHIIDKFDERLQITESGELNITAAAIVLGKLVLANRGATSKDINNFVVTDIDLWKKQDTEEISLLPVKYPEHAPEGILLTGMCYSSENDWLLLTFITEETAEPGSAQVYASHLALVENASRKVARKQVKINEWVALNDISKKFEGSEIKALCIQSDKNGKAKVYLTAGNSETGTHVFKIRIKH